MDEVDADRYNSVCEHIISQNPYLKTRLVHSNDYKQIRFGYDDKGEIILKQGISGKKIEIPVADKWRKENRVEREIKKNEEFLIKMKRNIIKNGILHFDDCYFLADSYIRECPSIIRVLRNRFSYVLVDEAQDMQAHQLDIIDKCFNCNEVVLQRIGDPNQAIFDDASVVSNWQGRNPSYIHNSLRLTQEIASIVDHLVIGRGDADESHNKFEVKGIRALTNPIKPHLLLYTEDRRGEMKNKFWEIIRRYDLHNLEEGKKYGFHIIGWTAEWYGQSHKRDNVRLVDLFPEYSVNRSRTNVVANTLSEQIQQNKYIGSFCESRDCMLDIFVSVLRRSGLRASDERSYTRAKVLMMIRERDESSQSQFREDLLRGTKILSTGHWQIAYNEVKLIAIKWLKDYFKKTPDDKVNEYLGERFESRLTVQRENDTAPSEIPISVGTVHSVKGMTHCATLYVETSYYGKYESQYVIEEKSAGRGANRITTIVSPLLMQDLFTAPDSRVAKAKRMMYVGFSRPTHLLCYASAANLWTEDRKHLMENAGWIVEYV